MLRRLRVLGLSSHTLSGPFPPAIGTRRRLRVFDLSSNRLQGGIPVVLPCVALQMLDLA